MAQNFLITGGAGFIGGSVLAGLLANNSGIKPENITALVRTGDLAQKLSKLGIRVVKVDLTDGEKVTQAVLDNDVEIVIHCASAVDPTLAFPLIEALGKRVEKTGKAAYIIHTSGTSAYADKTGWLHGPVKDTDQVRELEQKTDAPYFVRDTNVAVGKHADKHGVTACLVVPPFIYGKGTGECGQLSFQLPGLIRAAIAQKKVYKFVGTKGWPAVHISDVVDLYMRLVGRIASAQPSLPGSVAGYFFAVGHHVDWTETMDALAAAMHARGLASEPEAAIWPSDEFAAETLGIPAQFLPVLWFATTTAISERSLGMGWTPAWDRTRFLQSLGDEIEAAGSSTEKTNSSTLDHVDQATA